MTIQSCINSASLLPQIDHPKVAQYLMLEFNRFLFLEINFLILLLLGWYEIILHSQSKLEVNCVLNIRGSQPHLN